MVKQHSINELHHHGIKNMKWGVRNGPPYPLSKSMSTGRRLKKQSNTSTRNKTVDDLIASGKARVDNLSSYSVAGLTTMTTKTGEQYVSGLMHGHDFDWQESIDWYVDGERTTRTVSDSIKEDPNSFGFMENDPIHAIHAKGQLSEYDMNTCNPGFGQAGTTQNCAKCSADLEMKLRGYSVSAGRQSYPSSSDAMSHWFKGAERIDVDTDAAEELIYSYGKKTSGTISIRYTENMGGHAMHWTVDNDGIFEIQDGQNNRRFSSISSMMEEYGADKSKGLTVFRLDNCEPDLDNMAADSVLRNNPRANRIKTYVKNKFTGKEVSTW